ncbi:MAG: polysaccharide biosynthesis protein [Verrucomicrobia bacterium]|nr:polysaccharide biosynthesis protein [Verrucomicrobiota bacterium]
MPLIEFPPATVTEVVQSPYVRRILQRGRMVGNFAGIQVLVQFVGFLSGILIVRVLDQRQYAYFTIANTMQGTLNLLADIGISVGLVSIGGRVWQDRSRFSELISTAFYLRRRLAVIGIIAVTPILYLLLAKNGARPAYCIFLVSVVLAGLAIHLDVGVLGVIPRLRSDISLIQWIDFIGVVLRLALLVVLAFVFLNAGAALTVSTVVIFIQYLLLRRYSAGIIDFGARQNSDDRTAMLGFIRSQAANAIFYCVQGQITVFLISFFAHQTSSVAEVGALGRLAMIFTILTNLLTNIFVPAFARCQDPRRMRSLYLEIVGGVTCFCILIISAAAIFPGEFLFILGNKYAHLHRELLLMVGASVLAALSGTFWSLNASKAWITGSWLYIPLTLIMQIALIPVTDFSSVTSVLVFNLLSGVPNLLLNLALSWRGFRSWRPATA